MTRFKKKPIEVDAFQYGVDDMPDWAEDARRQGILVPVSQYGGGIRWCEIHTLEGVMKGDIGDYIIKGVKGEVYPCKPDIFEMTYDTVKEIKEPEKGTGLLKRLIRRCKGVTSNR